MMSDTSPLEQRPAQGVQHKGCRSDPASSATGHSLGWDKKLHISYLHHAILGLWTQLQFLLTQGKISSDCLSRRPGPFIPPFLINFQIFTKHYLKSPHLAWIKNKRFPSLEVQDSQECQSWGTHKLKLQLHKGRRKPSVSFLPVCRWRQSLF